MFKTLYRAETLNICALPRAAVSGFVRAFAVPNSDNPECEAGIGWR
jgi:hypothetical protein